jgi:hypothetical protein
LLRPGVASETFGDVARMTNTQDDDHHKSDGSDIDSLIRTWIVVAAAVVSWLLPIPWYWSVAVFLVALLPLGIFYPAILIRPRK